MIWLGNDIKRMEQLHAWGETTASNSIFGVEDAGNTLNALSQNIGAKILFKVQWIVILGD